jgi:hypothetical protein
VIAVGWLTDVENGFFTPTYNGPFLKLVTARHLAVQDDGRGFGKSDRGVRPLTLRGRFDYQFSGFFLRVERKGKRAVRFASGAV